MQDILILQISKRYQKFYLKGTKKEKKKKSDIWIEFKQPINSKVEKGKSYR